MKSQPTREEVYDLLFSLKFCAGSCHHTEVCEGFAEKYGMKSLMGELIEYQNKQSNKCHELTILKQDSEPPKQYRYEKVTKGACSELMGEFECGGMFSHFTSCDYNDINSEKQLALMWSNGNIYRRIELTPEELYEQEVEELASEFKNLYSEVTKDTNLVDMDKLHDIYASHAIKKLKGGE